MSTCYFLKIGKDSSVLCMNGKLQRHFCKESLLNEKWEYEKCKHKEISTSNVNQRERFEEWKKKELEYWGVY